MSKKGFHTPFEKLKGLTLPPVPAADARASTPTATSTPLSERGPASASTPAPADAPPADESQMFADEMSGVAPLDPDPRGRLGAPLPPAPAPRRRARDEAEAYAQLADLAQGEGPFDIAETDEHIEGSAPGIDRRLVRNLKKGDYAIQAHLDLHGLTADEAHGEVERFITLARTRGLRTVLIVHGRGLHSKDAIPVLKERLKVWLSRGRVARCVLAFTTARRADGGPGAVYVLLRK